MILEILVVAFIAMMSGYIILAIIRETLADLRYHEWLDMLFDDVPNWWRQ